MSNVVKLTPVVRGDTWNGFSLSYSSEGSAFDAILSSVSLKFLSSDGATEHELTSTGGGITIVDAVNWVIQVNSFVMTYEADVWSFAVQTTDANSAKKTRVTGTLEVLSEPS